MRSESLFLGAVLAVCGLARPSAAGAEAKLLPAQLTTGSVQFVSDAPLEHFTGKSSSVHGHLSFDPHDLKTVSGEFTVDTASIKTNLALRDEHLASDSWLDAKKYPKAKFSIGTVAGARKIEPGVTSPLKISGKFTLHGVTRPVTADAKVRLQSGSKAVHVLASFMVHLEDYGIAIPKLVSLKVSPDIIVNVDLHMSVR